MHRLNKTFFLCIFHFLVCLDLFAGIEETSFSRNDESQATAYISTPDNSDSFPLVIFIDGSHMQSVKNNFSVISFLFNQKEIGVIAIEKRGITKDEVNLEEFLTYDSFENRLEDHMQLINELNTKIANWNGQLVFIGSSEGGKIAPKLTLHFAESAMGTILIGSGGGLPFGEEMKYQIKQISIANGNEFDGSELDRQIEEKYALMLDNPYYLKKWYDKTYQWFASYLRYNLLDDLLNINTPILMIHGVLDTHVPVESADLIKINFDNLGKDNLTYLRDEDLGHSISKRFDIFMLLLNFSSEHFHNEALAVSY
jgi:predicted esterase